MRILDKTIFLTLLGDIFILRILNVYVGVCFCSALLKISHYESNFFKEISVLHILQYLRGFSFHWSSCFNEKETVYVSLHSSGTEFYGFFLHTQTSHIWGRVVTNLKYLDSQSGVSEGLQLIEKAHTGQTPCSDLCRTFASWRADR